MPIDPRRPWRAPMAVAAVFVASTTAATTAGPAGLAGADDAATAYTVDQITTGYWNGTAFAAGNATGVIEGMDTSLVANITAGFDFLAIEDGAGPGSVVGTWSHDGSGILDFSGNMQGQAVTGHGELGFSGTQGSMTGDTRRIELRGDSRTTGPLVASAAGQSTSVQIDNVTPLPTLEVTVLGGTCELVHGNWVYSIASTIADQGLSATFGGHWTAWRDNTQDFDDELEAMSDSVTAQLEQGSDELALSGSPAFDTAADLFVEYAEFAASGDDWDIDSVISLLSDAEDALSELRAGSECERTFLDGVEKFDTLLTFVIQELIRYAVLFAEPTTTQWQLLANLAVRTGAVGSGAPNPELAADAEAAMIQYAERQLDALVGDDGTLPTTDDVMRLVGTSAVMGWDLAIGGTTASAQQWWANLEGN